jgi:zinc transporter ZupT
MDQILEPLLLSLISGSLTVIGGIIVFTLKRISDRVVSFSLAFASGVKLFVESLDFFFHAVELLTHFELKFDRSKTVLRVRYFGGRKCCR